MQVSVDPHWQFGAAWLHQHLLCPPLVEPPSVATLSIFRTGTSFLYTQVIKDMWGTSFKLNQSVSREFWVTSNYAEAWGAYNMSNKSLNQGCRVANLLSISTVSLSWLISAASEVDMPRLISHNPPCSLSPGFHPGEPQKETQFWNRASSLVLFV